ncbi:MAG: sensor histidine kinase [Reyranella sp.]
MPLLAALLAIAIFIVDTATPLEFAVAVLYVGVVLLAMDFAGRRGTLIVTVACAGLTLLSFAITHSGDLSSGAILRMLISLSAITITGTLAARHLRAMATVREHARLLDLTHDTIFVRNLDDVIVFWNRAATELYGWSREQAIGRKASDLLQTQFPAPFETVMGDVKREGRWEGELVHTCSDGRKVTVASRWSLRRDERDRPIAILETNNDITERRQVEDGLNRTRGELAHVARVATMGELTASIAHEVNQPLAAIVTNGEACLRWLGRAVPDIGQARKSVESMIRSGQRASDVVARLRTLSRRGDAGHTPVALPEIVNDVALLIRHELRVHYATLSIQAPANLPAVRGDKVQLQQVVMNLLMNGLQAMDGITDRTRRLTVEIKEDDTGSVVLAVSDSGPGIAPEAQRVLFDAFFTTKPDGMGMGLSICRSIVEAHGGHISASNLDSGGARIAVSLPRHADQAA